MTAPIGVPHAVAILTAMHGARIGSNSPEELTKGLMQLSEASFRDIVMEAIAHRNAPVGEQQTPLSRDAARDLSPDPSPQPNAPAPPAPIHRSHPMRIPPAEADLIVREAQRTGIDPDLLAALRRVENGGPGREFGVLGTPAPGLEEQARIAANTIRKTVARFEQQGKEAVDLSTGRYTNEFLRFFSARYAPSGAMNDPGGLNRFHAANLIALYRKASEGAVRG
jgi:hypothetical protein